MKLMPTASGWLLGMDQGRIQRLEIDFRLGVHFSDKDETAALYIETPCYLRREAEAIHLMPGDPASLAPVLALVNTGVIAVAIEGNGHLRVRLKDKRSLEVGPDERYEAWQIGCPGCGFLLVCSPGGEVSLFQQEVKEP